jgi:acyl transferase domain-containing protein/NAD(P)H-dependent flavin oxidoreductase YrpB (nitropropane dioxygenase family)
MRHPEARVLALAPSGQESASFAVAATRAGALAIFDSTPLNSRATVFRDLMRASRFVSQPLGVRTDARLLDDAWLAELPAAAQIVVATGGRDADWQSAIARTVKSGRVVLAEVCSRAQAQAAMSAGAPGVIVAGHEAGGLCSEESSYILTQAVLAICTVPVWVRGGIGPFSAAACVAMGAAGVVLDGALLLAKEIQHEQSVREALARFDGAETHVIGPACGPFVRVHAAARSAALDRLRAAALAGGAAWEDAVRDNVGWAKGLAWPVGQDAAFAAGLARRYVTVGGIIQAVETAIDEGLRAARRLRPLAPGAALAASHGTRFPIVQGPMTRVSDIIPFAEAVADGGGLPFLALAMLRGDAVRELLAEAARTMKHRPYGVGILGFVPPELRQEQVAAVSDARPPFALIAGGRPDQARDLESQGIVTYLHVPSPGLLAQFWKDGARRFVLEGRECGGHVGPRSSLVLWQQAADVLLAAIDRGESADGAHVLFAGGIHDARSASAVAALAAPLAAHGAKIGVLVGTAYLFTREIVEAGAIVPRFQQEALRCHRTVLLETGPGHEVRVGPSPFVDAFTIARQRLIAQGGPAEEIRAELERINAGRLRVATKGYERASGVDSPLVAVPEADQFERGIYMLGQVATLRSKILSIAELHRDISERGTERLASHTENVSDTIAAPSPSNVAIVGIAAHFPGATDVHQFWANTLKGFDAISEVPPDHWDWRPYYDPDPKAPDKIVSKWGGFLPDIPFDPIRYGMPPSSLPSIEPAQLLVLEAVRAALDDAGYSERHFPKERTAVVLGMGGGAAQLAMGYAFRSYLPMLEAVAPEAGKEARELACELLPEWTEDSFPGFLLNVTAGRVANRFDLGGANYTVDAACGSSLAAASLAVRELETGAADMVVLGGADTVQNPFTYLAFSKTQAFSPRGRCRPFDDSADGIVISEGVGVVILKRLADAERDGDRIYAVIKGLGASSDGRERGLTAPSAEGQSRALRRAYRKAGVDPTTVGYFEAHGTGTALGDVVEVNALSETLRAAGAKPSSCAIGSIKSMIGHTKCAAGLAGLINASLALHHRVLPPTIGVERVNPRADLQNGPLRVNTKTQLWLHADTQHPRRAGVSAFGFGGTNFHAVLESYEGDPTPHPSPLRTWPAELFVWREDNRSRLTDSLKGLAAALESGARPPLRDLSHTLLSRFRANAPTGPTVAIVAASIADLHDKLKSAVSAIEQGEDRLHDSRGIYYAQCPEFHDAPVAFLFPGQGAQTLEMLGDLALAFSEVRSGFEAVDAGLIAEGRQAISIKVFPPTTLDEAASERARRALTETDVAQPAVGAACVGMLRLLDALGLSADMVAGHSFGELVALHAAGAMSVESLAVLSEARGRLMREATGNEIGGMAAIVAGPGAVQALIADEPRVVAANFNGPKQTVIAGPRDDLARVLTRAGERGLRTVELAVSCAFHSPLVASASSPLATRALELMRQPPRIPVFANLDATPHPTDVAEIAARLGRHLASPVQFQAMIEAMYDTGARVFVEVGPGAACSSLTSAILADRPHLSVACDVPGRPCIPTLLHAMARLIVGGVRMRPQRLTERRGAKHLNLDRLSDEKPAQHSPSTWLVNGCRARAIDQPEPKRLGQAMSPPSLLRERSSGEPGQNGNGKHDRQPIVPSFSGDGAQSRPNRDKRFKNVAASSPIHRNGDEMDSQKLPVHQSRNAAPLDVNTALDRGVFAAPDSESSRRPARHSQSGTERVMESFQQTMREFLEVQQATMFAYLARQPLGSQPVAETRLDEAPTGHAIAAAPATKPIAPPRAEPRRPVAEPSPAQESDTQQAPEHAPGANGQSVAAKLVEIVRQRTGYPPETLKLDLDLEADLGIDSIKRVEILGSLRDAVPELERSTDSALMDRLTGAKTLAQIVERVEAALGKARAGSRSRLGSRKGADSSKIAPVAAHSQVRRLVLEAVECPRPRNPSGLVPGGLVIVTQDDRGVARALAVDLRAQGYKVELMGLDAEREVDLSSPASVESSLSELRRQATITGIIHALPLCRGSAPSLDQANWSASMASEVQGLFLLARAAADDLDRASSLGGSCLIAATAMGGAFGSVGEIPKTFFAGQGAITGLMKTLAREWPEVRTRVVDFDPQEPPAELASQLLAEALTDDGWAEVGYRTAKRLRLRTVPSSLDRATSRFAIEDGAPILVTGGARGITGAVAVELAKRYRPTLLLIGTSALPEDREDRETASITEPAALKAALHDRLARDGNPTSPQNIDAAFKRLIKAREIRRTLEQIRATGAEVEYAQGDVRAGDSLGRVLDAWRARYGDLVGLIHGAGVIHDKLLRDKKPETFNHVLSTKLDGTLNLARLVKPESLKFAALFSSVAGRFGNQGQSDYAAANDALNKLAIWLDGRWPARVLSVIWGPWSGVGMVSDLEGHLGRRGLGMIAPEAGCAAFLNELEKGRKGEVEVIIAAGLGTLEEPLRRDGREAVR